MGSQRLITAGARVIAAAGALAALTVTQSLAQSGPAAPALQTLVSFDGVAAAFPDSNLSLDAAGNLLGTTRGGGRHGAGTVFEIVKTGATTFATKPTVLVSFGSTASDGAFPVSGLVADPAGNLYGTTNGGGSFGKGVVFMVAKTATGYAATEKILANLSFSVGESPTGPLVIDGLGNLYGTTTQGGLTGCPSGQTTGCGTVFEIVKSKTGYASAPKALVQFDGANGQSPNGGLLFDAAGNLLGTATSGGPTIAGVLFEITKTATGYASKPLVLASFGLGAAGAFPRSTLVKDGNGDLFGTADQGGAGNSGVVFELAKNATGYSSAATAVAALHSSQGEFPQPGVIIDSKGNLFGVALMGGSAGDGSVFKVAKTAAGYSTVPTVLASFAGSANGSSPQGRLVADAQGHLFGTTDSGGRYGFGTVYEITGAGYSPP